MDELREELPVFANASEALPFLDMQEEIARQQLEREAQERMAQDSLDPRNQQYFMRTDRKTVVKDDKEYKLCMDNRIPMTVIPYSHALQLLKVEDARKRQKLKAKKAKKTAKASRKKNRR